MDPSEASEGEDPASLAATATETTVDPASPTVDSKVTIEEPESVVLNDQVVSGTSEANKEDVGSSNEAEKKPEKPKTVDEESFFQETAELLQQTEQLLTQSERALVAPEDPGSTNAGEFLAKQSGSTVQQVAPPAATQHERSVEASFASGSASMMKTLNLDDSGVLGATSKMFPLTALRAIPRGYCFISDRSIAPTHELFLHSGPCLCAKVNLRVSNATVLSACAKLLKKLWVSPVKSNACIHGAPKIAHPAPQVKRSPTAGIQSFLVALGAAKAQGEVRRKEQRVVCMVGVEVQSKERMVLIALPLELQEKLAMFKQALDQMEDQPEENNGLEASTLPGVADSISCLKEVQVLSKDYTADLDAAHAFAADCELKEYATELDKIAEMEEWKLARVMSILKTSYSDAGINFPTIQRPPPLESFQLTTSPVDANVSLNSPHDTTVEKADRLVKLRLKSRWKNQVESRKGRKQKHFNARISTCTSNCSQLIGRLRDSAVAFTSKETLDFIRKMNFSGDLHAVLLARVAALYKGRPGTLYVTYHHVCFYSAIFAYTTRIILNIETYSMMSRVHTLSVLNTLRLTSVNQQEEPMEFVIPSTADFDRFSELVDQVLLLRKREKLKASPQVSRGAVDPAQQQAPTLETQEREKHDIMSASTMLQPDEFEC